MNSNYFYTNIVLSSKNNVFLEEVQAIAVFTTDCYSISCM